LFVFEDSQGMADTSFCSSDSHTHTFTVLAANKVRFLAFTQMSAKLCGLWFRIGW
jgi:hypothetical protein